MGVNGSHRGVNRSIVESTGNTFTKTLSTYPSDPNLFINKQTNQAVLFIKVLLKGIIFCNVLINHKLNSRISLHTLHL